MAVVGRLGRLRPLVVLGVVAASVPATPGHGYPRPGSVEMASISATGGDLSDERNRPWTTNPAVTSDGRFVAFTSSAQDLVPESENPQPILAKTQAVYAVFVHDRRTGKNVLVSKRADGKPTLCPLGGSSCKLGDDPSISDDGRYVAFTSSSPNLVDLDTNLSPDVFVRDLKTGSLTRVSVNSAGEQGGQASGWPSISADGRYVAFESSANNLVPGDTNNASDVFVHDRTTRTTTRVSVDSAGNEARNTAPTGGIASSVIPEISKTGRYVAFLSFATNLDGTDLNNRTDIFLHDRVTKKTTMVSVTTDGSQTNHNSGGRLGVSADGRYVSFISLADNLVPNDSNDTQDAFVRDVVRRRTIRASVTSVGHQATRPFNPAVPVLTTFPPSYDSSMSWSGRFVNFWSIGTDFGTTSTGVAPSSNDLFVYDTLTGLVTMATTTPSGQIAVDDGPCSNAAARPCAYSGTGIISGSGRYVALSSSATNFDRRHTRSATTPDPNRIYVRDLGLPLGAGAVVRGSATVTAAAGTPAAPPRESARLAGARLVHRPGTRDLYGVVELDALDVAGAASGAVTVYGMTFTSRGVRYQVRAQRLPGADLVAAFTLHRERAGGRWDPVADLQGGYGTTGAEVVFAVPLGAVGDPAAAQVSGVDAFSAFGGGTAGSLVRVDELLLAS